ncbi:MAG: hypothetical protein ACSLFP_08660 [Acidimicrobiales bacterium]
MVYDDDQGTPAGLSKESTILVVLNDVPTPAALVDAHGAIQAVNTAWLEFGRANGAVDPGASIGWSYTTWLDAPDAGAAQAAAGVMAVVGGLADEFTQTYPCHSPTEQRWFRFLVVPVAPGAAPRAVLAVHLPLGPGVAERLHELAQDLLTQEDRPPVLVCAWCDGLSRYVDGGWTESPPDQVIVGPVSHGICPGCLERVLT